MRVLLANLEFLCHRRVVWLYVLLAAPVALGLWLRSDVVGSDVSALVPFASDSLNTPVTGVLLVWVMGLIVAIMQMEVVSRPFAFCLPGHPVVLKRLVFVVGVVATLVVSLAWPAQSVPVDSYRLRFFCTSLVAYFIGARMGLSRRGGLIGIIFAPMLLLISLIPLPDLSGQYFAFPSTISAVVLSVGAATAMWLWLGRTSLSQRYCDRPVFQFFGGLNRSERERRGQAVAWPRRGRMTMAGADPYLLRIMEGCKPLRSAKYVWGMLYVWRLPYGGSRLEMVLAAFSGMYPIITGWYMPTFGLFAVPFASMMMELNRAYDLPTPASMLVAGGRRERFLAGLAMAVVRAVTLILVLVLSSLLMDWLGVYTPLARMRATAIEGGERPIALGLAVSLTAVMPVARLLATALPGRWKMQIAICGGFACLLSLYLFRHGSLRIEEVSLGHVVAVHLLSWVLCAYGMYRIVMRSDLVRR